MEGPSAQTKQGALVFWMIVLGLFAAWAATSDILRNWHVLVISARICNAMILVSGALLLAAGLLQVLSGAKRRAPAIIGAIASGLLAATLFVGVWSGAIPCSGPS